MTCISKQKVVPYSPKEMFELVDNVTDYHEFLPWCSKSEEHCRDDELVEASLTVDAHGMQKSFTTKNRRQINKMIEIRLVDGPFKHLEGFWRFEEIDGGHCKVSFDLEFEFAGKLMSMALTPLFSQIGNSMIEAFCTRAEDLYAKS